MARAATARGDRGERQTRSPMEERILAAAVTLFAERGFDVTAVQQIVDRAEVTKGALYHYFDSKDELLYEIYRALIGVQNADLDAIVERGLSAADTVRAILVDVVTTTANRLPEAVVFFREAHKLDDKQMVAYRADRRRYHESFRKVIANGQALGEFSTLVPAETVVQIAMGVVNQLPVWFRADGPKTPEQLGNEIADFVLASLRV